MFIHLYNVLIFSQGFFNVQPQHQGTVFLNETASQQLKWSHSCLTWFFDTDSCGSCSHSTTSCYSCSSIVVVLAVPYHTVHENTGRILIKTFRCTRPWHKPKARSPGSASASVSDRKQTPHDARWWWLAMPRNFLFIMHQCNAACFNTS